MKSIGEILQKKKVPFDVENFGGLGEDEFVKDEMIYCKNCGGARMFVNEFIQVRCICKCQAEKKMQEEEERKEADRKKAISQLQRASLIGDRYKNASFQNTETGHNSSFDTAFLRCKKYCEVANTVLEKGMGIYLYGKKGTGKTHLTACMANDLIQQQKQVLFTNFFEISKMLRGTFNNSTESEADYIHKLATVDFLIIDDLGTERVQASNGGDLWLQEKIFEILNKRYNAKKPTIFNSNHFITELITERGVMDKTVDRIMEMSTAIIEITGESYRFKKRTMDEVPF